MQNTPTLLDTPQQSPPERKQQSCLSAAKRRNLLRGYEFGGAEQDVGTCFTKGNIMAHYYQITLIMRVPKALTAAPKRIENVGNGYKLPIV